MRYRGSHQIAGEQRVGFRATLQRMFGKGTAFANPDDNDLTGRVADVNARVGSHRESYCPDCGFGVLRSWDDPAIRGSDLMEKLRAAPGALQCDRCDYLAVP